MNGDNGGFMVPEDQEVFTRQVVELLDDRDLWNKKSEEARSYAKNWSSRAMAKTLLEIYEELIARKEAGTLEAS